MVNPYIVATNLSTIPDKIMYVETPWFASIWFWIGIFVVIVALIIVIANAIIFRQKRRLIVEIDNPDFTFETHVFRNFSGTSFHIENHEKTADGEKTYTDYKFNPSYIIHGVWGKRIRYDYGNPEPKNPLAEQKSIPMIVMHAIQFLESLANTKLLSELVLSGKFKEFVKMMLTIAVTTGILCLILNAAILYFVLQLHNIDYGLIANITKESCSQAQAIVSPILRK